MADQPEPKYGLGDRVKLMDGWRGGLMEPYSVVVKREFWIVWRYDLRGADDIGQSRGLATGVDESVIELVAHSVPMDADDVKALALLNDGFDRGHLVCDSWKTTKSEQDDYALAMLRLERMVKATRGEVPHG